jgi:hypothetical protein
LFTVNTNTKTNSSSNAIYFSVGSALVNILKDFYILNRPVGAINHCRKSKDYIIDFPPAAINNFYLSLLRLFITLT